VWGGGGIHEVIHENFYLKKKVDKTQFLNEHFFRFTTTPPDYELISILSNFSASS
jgi:hypothetical protein